MAGRPTRRPASDRDPAGTRRAILDAAERLLARGGEEGLSIRELCARAGVTAPTVYHHFGDKQALIERVVDACFAEFDRAFDGRDVPSDPVAALGWSFDRYVTYAAAHPRHYRLLFGRRPERPTPSALAAYARLERLIAAVEATGRLTVPAVDATPAVWAAVHGASSLVIAGFLTPAAPAVALVRDAMLAHVTVPVATARAPRGPRRTSDAA